jgi:hypothetical protein
VEIENGRSATRDILSTTQSEDANDLFRRKPAYSAALSPDKMAIAVVQVTSASPRRSGDMA